MSKYMRMKSKSIVSYGKSNFTVRFIYCYGFQFQVLCQNFLNATNSKDRPTVHGKKTQQIVKLTF